MKHSFSSWMIGRSPISTESEFYKAQRGHLMGAERRRIAGAVQRILNRHRNDVDQSNKQENRDEANLARFRGVPIVYLGANGLIIMIVARSDGSS
jgi:hypothetical protein